MHTPASRAEANQAAFCNIQAMALSSGMLWPVDGGLQHAHIALLSLSPELLSAAPQRNLASQVSTSASADTQEESQNGRGWKGPLWVV